MLDVTDEYKNMIESFECDFSLARDGEYSLYQLEDTLKEENVEFNARLVKDIELLEKLSYGLRYEKLKIVEVEEME
jgi:hypothetical protein